METNTICLNKKKNQKSIKKTRLSKEFTYQNELLEILKKLLPLHSVYVISAFKEKKKQNVYVSPESTTSQKAMTYTLLIITYKPVSKRLGDFMDDLYGKMQQRCKVYAIMYTLSKVKKCLDYGDNFLTQVLFHTTCIYNADDSLSQFNNTSLFYDQSVYDHIEKTWKRRMDRAEYLLSIIDSIEHKEDSSSRLSIMHYALEQICIALLYIFWELNPQHYSLSYLMHLCSHFTELPQRIFPKESYGLHRIYYMLCNAPHIARFKSKNEFSNLDTDKAYNRCERFYSEAYDTGQKQLLKLKDLHCKTSKKEILLK